MKRKDMGTENLAIGLLDTDKKLVYGVLNTADYDVMGYVFVAGDTSDCLESVGCYSEDIEASDSLKVGEVRLSECYGTGVLIVKMKDSR